ncbi:hypothetical protein LCGC14_2218960 [marine sediment metagenome]|uniref:Uncharacterized protein n=1 Tax=marine sediment metagenome TaxID=412755 RepID=A0A0F9DBP6_9ZZZZ
MKLKEYVEKNDFVTGKGLPQGDTILNINEVDVLESEYDGNPRFQLKWKEGDVEHEYYVPKGVLADIKKLAADGAVNIRVTRTGTTKSDTRYTVIKVEGGQ